MAQVWQSPRCHVTNLSVVITTNKPAEKENARETERGGESRMKKKYYHFYSYSVKDGSSFKV